MGRGGMYVEKVSRPVGHGRDLLHGPRNDEWNAAAMTPGPLACAIHMTILGAVACIVVNMVSASPSPDSENLNNIVAIRFTKWQRVF